MKFKYSDLVLPELHFKSDRECTR